MIPRIALWFSFLALGASVLGLFLMGTKLTDLTRRVSALENRSAPATPPVPRPATPDAQAPAEPESRQDQKRRTIRQVLDKENQAHLDALAKKLGLETGAEAKLRAAFTEEFDYYIEGVIRDVDALQSDDSKSEGNWLDSPEFRKELEDRIAAADLGVRALLTAYQATVYDQWRRDLRKERYELD